MTEISAIIPTHLRPDLLADAIASVAAQTMPVAELLVVDDADDGATRAVVAAAAQRDTIPIRYLYNPDGGVCHSRNLGAQAATTRWVGLLDDDDVWRPTFTARLLDALQRSGAQLAIGGIVRHEAGRPPRPRQQLTGLTPADVLRAPGSMTGSNFIVDRSALLAVAGFDPAMTVFNDWDLFVRLIDHGIKYVVDAAPLADWQDHSGERIATFSVRRADGLDRFVDRYRDRLAPTLVRDFTTTALGIRRQHATHWLDRLGWSIRLAQAHGSLSALKRLADRLR